MNLVLKTPTAVPPRITALKCLVMLLATVQSTVTQAQHVRKPVLQLRGPAML